MKSDQPFIQQTGGLDTPSRLPHNEPINNATPEITMIKIAAILTIIGAALIMFGAAADSMQTVMHVTVGMRG